MDFCEGKCEILFHIVRLHIYAFISLFQKLMEMNYLSAVNTTKAALPSMIQQQRGRIVFLSSQAGQIGLFGFSAYSGSKFALRGMAEALQMEVQYLKK